MNHIDKKVLARRERARRWYSRNAEKAKAHTANWRKKNMDKVRAEKSKWACIPSNRLKTILAQAKRRAIATGIEYSIKVEDLLPLPTHCPVFGTPINYNGTDGARLGGFINNSPSVDRINPALGYTPGNVKVISWRANRLKSDATAAELLAILAYVEKEKGLAQCN